jgi:two-component system sensor histidine kinase DctS
MDTARIAAESKASGWLWWLPRLSFVLFVGAVAALLWLSSRMDSEEQRATLISDMLWLEQSLRFTFTHNEELLGQMAARPIVDQASLEAHARILIENQTGLRAVAWLDHGGHTRFTYPAATTLAVDPEIVKLAVSLARPVYGKPFPTANGEWSFQVYLPVADRPQSAGVVTGRYEITRMLQESVPWWLAERYRIVVADAEGKSLASRSKVETPTTTGGYQLAFEPPGHGLSLQATPYRIPAPLAGRLLSAALVFLAIVVLWSLWALRRHVQGRMAAETALRNEHAFRKAMEDSVQAGLRARDLEGRITYVNPAFCAMVGWSSAELIGQMPPMPYWVDEELEATRALHDRILAGEGPSRGFEVPFRRRNGEIFPVLIHEAPLIDASGCQTGWMSSVIDISDQKRAEELSRQQHDRLQSTARLVTMGEMASSLAHELNQPLAAIASYNAGCLQLLNDGHTDAVELKDALAKSTAQAQRAGRVIRRIYEFVRRAEPKSEPCSIADLIDRTVALVEPDARRHRIRIERKIQSGLPEVQGDGLLLEQAILNLIRNAIEAMRDLPGDLRLLTLRADAEQDQIHLSIADRGAGIPEAVSKRLFDPFFSTKSEGLGMGLNICRSVIEGHKGRLWLEPNPQGGSIFHVLLPITGQ